MGKSQPVKNRTRVTSSEKRPEHFSRSPVRTEGQKTKLDENINQWKVNEAEIGILTLVSVGQTKRRKSG